jgi:hypothetical protein
MGLELYFFDKLHFFEIMATDSVFRFTKLNVENRAKKTLKWKLRIFNFFNGK